LLRNVYGVLIVGNVLKVPDGKGRFFGIELTAMPPSQGEPAEAKELEFRKPDDPSLDPKNEFVDLLTLTFRDKDIEEFRSLPTSRELEAWFVEQGFSIDVAHFISSAVVRQCLEALPKRKRGRPPRPVWERMEKHAQELERIKRVLRANGEKGSVHKKAMQILQNNYEQVRQGLDPEQWAYLPPFPYDAIEHYVRRAKRRSTK